MALGRIEAGSRTVSLGEAISICEALGTSLSAMTATGPLEITEVVRLD